MKDVIKSLADFGLTEKEAAVYIALLETGRSNVKKIAIRARQKRPNTYVLLEELRKKGFVLKIPFSNKIQYEAKDPKEIKSIITSKFENFNAVYPLLEKTAKDSDSFDTFYYEGLDGLNDAYSYKIDTLANKKIIGFGAKADRITEDIQVILNNYDINIIKKNITYEGITVDHPSIRKDILRSPKIYEKIKLLSPDIYNSDVSIEACGDFVRVADFKEMKVVIIESKKLSSALESIYKLSVSGLDK